MGTLYPVQPRITSALSAESHFIVAVLPIFAVAAFFASPPLSIASISYPDPQEPSKYGDLAQSNEDNCGPTAVVNSFVYLMNKYPDQYKNLIPGDITDYGNLQSVAAGLAGAGYMNTQNGPTLHGTTPDWFVYGKAKYLEDHVPGQTTYLAQMSTAWGADPAGWPALPPSGQTKPGYVQDNTFPTQSVLTNELNDHEDVEILLTWGGGAHSHYVTVTGVVANPPSSTLTFNYVDPTDGENHQGTIQQMTQGSTTYLQATDAQGDVAVVTALVAESVPEPSITSIMLCASAIGLLRRRRRHVRPQTAD